MFSLFACKVADEIITDGIVWMDRKFMFNAAIHRKDHVIL